MTFGKNDRLVGVNRLVEIRDAHPVQSLPRGLEVRSVLLPTLQQYPPGLLNFCESAQKLSEQMVGEWLATYMLKRSRHRLQKAEAIASWLVDDKTHLSHSRAITRDELRARGIKIINLEDDPILQDLVLSAHHAIIHTFSGAAFKIIENQLGKRFVQQGGALIAPMPMALPGHPQS